MPINFLGEPKHPLKKIKTPDIVEMHLPAKEAKRIAKEKKKIAKAAKVAAQKKIEVKPNVTLGEVNLVKGFKAYLLKRRLTFLALLVIIILVVGSLIGYFLFIYKPQPKIVVIPPVIPPVQNVNANINQVVIQPVCGNGKLETGEECDDGNLINGDGCSADCQTEIIAPPPILPPASICGNGKLESGEECDDGNILNNDGCSFLCQKEISLPVILPDTELAPLRGALVKFANQATIYLVDFNGELREVDLQTVYFLNSQKVSEIKADLIYILADRYLSIRRGKIVRDKIEWDPRVLSQMELQPFK